VIEFLLDGFRQHAHDDAIVWHDRTYAYGWLRERVLEWGRRLGAEGVAAGAVVAVDADFSPNAAALLLALIEHRAVVVPLTASVARKRDELLTVAEVETVVAIDAADSVSFAHRGVRASHTFYRTLRARGSAGLVLFSSGSTGKSKGAVHDFTALLDKFRARRKAQRTIAFLLYDHIGGVNTLLHTLANQGTVITVPDRTPDAVLGAVAKHRAAVLPTSPTFINLVLLSEAWTRHDLTSLALVTYGTEPMPEVTLRRFHELFPAIVLQQTYGLSEVGILRSKSRDSISLWVKIGGEGFETRVVDGMLQIKARSAMLGYLNAPSPFTDDGWFLTGDAVDVDGEFLRILGRRSEMINVGGEKVYPAEVEGVLETMTNVVEATVYGERNAITGQIVCATVVVSAPEEAADLRRRVRAYCEGKLQPFKIPVKVRVASGSLHGERFKKLRAAG
jgi:acyl-CoA synthetase (AMP-forming)/AMP-acid ligase II